MLASLLFSVALLAAPAPAELAAAGQPGMRAIRPEALSARIRFLADDLLEGRGTGTRGHAIAERYVASEFQALGLEPVGKGASYAQDVPMRAARVGVAGSSLVVLHGAAPGETLGAES